MKNVELQQLEENPLMQQQALNVCYTLEWHWMHKKGWIENTTSEVESFIVHC